MEIQKDKLLNQIKERKKQKEIKNLTTKDRKYFSKLRNALKKKKGN